MPLELVTLSALSDNYCYLLHDPKSGATAAIDIPDAAPISAELAKRGWTLSDVWITHHHWDHIDGLPALLAEHPAKVTGAAADAHRLPSLDCAVSDGDVFPFGDEEVQVLDVSGHTVGHIAYFLPGTGLVFTADSLMALGCGRVFEGTFPQMWQSLQKLARLPEDTIVCSGHEYSLANGKFALTIDPTNTALISRVEQIKTDRANGLATVPTRLSTELATNPFLRAADPDIQSHLGMTGAAPEDVFAEIRRRKDNF